MTTERRIANLVARACAIDPGVLKRDRGLLSYGLDSVRATELVVELESTFGLVIADEDLVHVQTLAQMARYIDQRLGTPELDP
jgi:acyl carrier protein